MTDEFSKIFIKAKFEAFAKRNNADFSKFFSLLNSPTKRINDHEYLAGAYSVQAIRNMFNAAQEKVYIKDFENGLRKDLSDTLFESVFSIGRNQVILDMLENANPQELTDSIKKSKISMFEVDGKYYLEDDGNHRLMALKAFYYLEKSKNMTAEELVKLDEKFSFDLPVKHLNHSDELINAVATLKNKQKESRFFDYLTTKTPNTDSIYNFLTYDKSVHAYNIEYQSKSYKGLNEKKTIEVLTNLLSYDKPYSIYKHEKGYALELGNVLYDNLSANELNNLTAGLKTIRTTFSNEYKIIKKQNTYDLIINAKKYVQNSEKLKQIYSSAIAFNQNVPLAEMSKATNECDILNEKEISKQYFKNLDYIDIELNGAEPFVKINERYFENISKKELDLRLNQLAKERMFCASDTFSLNNELKEEKYL